MSQSTKIRSWAPSLSWRHFGAEDAGFLDGVECGREYGGRFEWALSKGENPSRRVPVKGWKNPKFEGDASYKIAFTRGVVQGLRQLAIESEQTIWDGRYEEMKAARKKSWEKAGSPIFHEQSDGRRRASLLT
jgi:hypothetical protein